MALCEGSVSGDIPVGPKDGNDFNHGTEELSHGTVDLTRSECDASRAVIHCRQGQGAKLTLWITDRNGAAVALPEDNDFLVKFIAKDRAMNTPMRIEASGTITDVATGKVEVILTARQLAFAGIYVSQVFITGPADETMWVTDYWLEVAWALDLQSTGPITIPEVRLILRDSCPGQNILLDDFEFDDSQILACMRMPLDEFNSRWEPQTNYVGRTFPYRFQWLRATAGYLLEIAARGYARDKLPYQAGGVSINDKDKFEIYLEMANQLILEWRDFIKERKVAMNIAGAYSSTMSGYSARQY